MTELQPIGLPASSQLCHDSRKRLQIELKKDIFEKAKHKTDVPIPYDTSTSAMHK